MRLSGIRVLVAGTLDVLDTPLSLPGCCVRSCHPQVAKVELRLNYEGDVAFPLAIGSIDNFLLELAVHPATLQVCAGLGLVAGRLLGPHVGCCSCRKRSTHVCLSTTTCCCPDVSCCAAANEPGQPGARVWSAACGPSQPHDGVGARQAGRQPH